MTAYDDELVACKRCGHQIKYRNSRLFWGPEVGTYRVCGQGKGCKSRQRKQGKEPIYP